MEPAEPRAVRWTRAAVWCAWAVLFVFVLSSFAAESPVRPGTASRLVQGALLPEGWSFFTRDPREPKSVAFRIEGRRLVPLTYANTSRANLFGVSRSARALDSEMMQLLTPVLESTWTDCRADPAECLAAPGVEPLALTNWSGTRRLCGSVAIVRAPPVPWAWRHSRARLHMPAKVLSLRVDCSRRRTVHYR